MNAFHWYDEGTDHHFFALDDPADAQLDVAAEPVILQDYDRDTHLNEWSSWSEGAAEPDVTLGHDPSRSKVYRIFPTEQHCRDEGYIPLGQNFFVGYCSELGSS